MKTRVLVVSLLIALIFTLGFLSGDVYRYLAIENNIGDGLDARATSAQESICPRLELSSVEDLSDSIVVKLLTALWGAGFEQTFSVERLAEFNEPTYRFFRNADVGGLITFCQLAETDAYIGFIEKSVFSIGELNQRSPKNDRTNKTDDYWLVLTVFDDNHAIGVSNAFGFDVERLFLEAK